MPGCPVPAWRLPRPSQSMPSGTGSSRYELLEGRRHRPRGTMRPGDWALCHLPGEKNSVVQVTETINE